MIWLMLGVALWFVGHLWNRFLPDLYSGLRRRNAYFLSLILILTSVALMILGYSRAEFVPLWPTIPTLKTISILLVLFAFYTYFATATPKGTVWLVGNLKHPQLSGFCIWAIAHLLVNGDVASVILFGGLLVWAMLEVSLINKQGEKFDRSRAPIKSRLGHLVLAGGMFILAAGIHVVVGVNPFA